MQSSAKFMVTNEMAVTPLSPTSVFDVIKELKAPVGNIVEKEVVLGESEVNVSLILKILYNFYGAGKRI